MRAKERRDPAPDYIDVPYFALNAIESPTFTRDFTCRTPAVGALLHRRALLQRIPLPFRMPLRPLHSLRSFLRRRYRWRWTGIGRAITFTAAAIMIQHK